MNVLEEILEWSQGRPLWQRDALRRLVQSGELSDDDLRVLTEICKSVHGLAEDQDVAPLAHEHLPETETGGSPVSLVSIFHHQGVNALAQDQTLGFGPKLTVVYGDNAAGKTGYIRILKSACRARGREKILGNVVSGTALHAPVVSIKYKVGTESQPREWAGDGEDDLISRVSVFDTQCAAVYLTEKTDVAFRPFGLALFDQLVQACKAIRSQLEIDQKALSSSALATAQRDVPVGTAAAKLLASVTSLTSPDSILALSRLSPDEDSRLELLEKLLLDLHANEPEKLIRQITLRFNRLLALSKHFKSIEFALSTENVNAVFAASSEVSRKSEEAKRLRALTFPVGMLDGTGSESWTALWEAARRFSHEYAYPHNIFPVVENDANCVLCQQRLNHDAGERLRRFESFVVSTTERELRQARENLARLERRFSELKVLNEAVDEAIKEIRIENENVADFFLKALLGNEERRKAVVLALAGNMGLEGDCPVLVSVAHEVDAFANQMEERIMALRSSASDEARKRLAAEAQELRARKVLAKHEKTVFDEIERKKKLAAYSLCINDTKTMAITQKSTAVTKMAVTQRLKQSFKNELESLAFRHAEVELAEAGGAEGVLYHKIVLTRAPGVELPRVVSEGEQRCLSIAAFFAELSTADDPSGIVFDDPVSSLDYRWREGVARRLVQEGERRQVIVFTHDVVFLLMIKKFAEEQGVEQVDQHVRQLSHGAGVCLEELPWVALPVKKKIGYLKQEWQAADKLFRNGHQLAYEKEAKCLYGLLREVWERAVEEVLLCGIVERFRPGIQTQHISTIADITPQDCQMVTAAMSKCSRWLAGHDQAAAARAPVPDSVELEADIQAVENWVAAIRGRRR